MNAKKGVDVDKIEDADYAWKPILKLSIKIVQWSIVEQKLI